MENETVRELREMLNGLQDGKRNAQYAFDKLRRTKMYAFEEKLNAEMKETEEAKHLRELTAKVAEAEKAYTLARDKAALQAANAPYPIGTRMARWQAYGVRATDGRVRLETRYRLTEDRGVLEVVTSSTVHPGNQGRYRRAAVGSFVIRLLRKNGLPGKEYVGCETYSLWRPEGVDLDAEKNAEFLWFFGLVASRGQR